MNRNDKNTGPAPAMASIVDAIFAAMREANTAHNTVPSAPHKDWLSLEECGGSQWEGEMGS